MRFTSLSPGIVLARYWPTRFDGTSVWPDGMVTRTTLGRLAETVGDLGLDTTTLFLVGPALGEGDPTRCSHVYDPGFTTRFREATS